MSKLLGIKELCELVQNIKTRLNGKVDKVAGKGLSTNDYTTAEKNKLAGIQAGAEVNVQSDWNQTNTSADDFIKNKPAIPTRLSQLTNDSDFVEDPDYVHTDNNFTTAEKDKLSSIVAGAQPNVQANWTETNTSSDAYIRNKPTIPTRTSQLTNDSDFVSDANYVHTDNNYTTAEKNKLAGIEAGAEKNRTYTAFTGKPTGNQTPGFGSTFTLQQIKQDTAGQVSGTDRTVKIPDTAATTTTAGLMSAADKTKLDGIDTGAEKNRTYTAFTGKPTGNLTPAFGATFTISQVKQSTTGQVSGTDRTVKIPDTAATTSAAGLMTAADKTKLNGIAEGAQVNRTYTAVTGKPTANKTPGFGSTFTVSQISQSTTGQITATDRTVKIPNTAATESAAGLMSAADKKKLNSISQPLIIGRDVAKANVTIAASNYKTVDLGEVPTVSGYTYAGIINSYYVTAYNTTDAAGSTWVFINNCWRDAKNNHIYVTARNFMTAQAKLTLGATMLFYKNFS